MKNASLTRIRIGMISAVLAFTLPTQAEIDAHGHDPSDHGDHAQAEEAVRGRVIHSVVPHLVFFVNADRKVEISAITENGEATPITEQNVRLIGGNRSNPTRMTFIPHESGLLSDIAFPPGNDFPVVLMVTPSPGAKMVIEKFNLNMTPCPTCSLQEYACTCIHKEDHHDHGDHEGHDH